MSIKKRLIRTPVKVGYADNRVLFIQPNYSLCDNREMRFRHTIAILAGKLVSWVSKTLGLGAGATWPGEVALRISPSILGYLSTQYTKGMILIVGTNGKTTTTSMISTILSKEKTTYLYNRSGANLLNGVVSASLIHWGKSCDYGIFEVDENSLPHVMRYVSPKIVIVLNLFRDQLDRYGEVEVIASKWRRVFKAMMPDSTLILNADDPLVSSFGKEIDAKTLYFGLSEKFAQDRKMDHATDSIFCQFCGGRLAYTSYFFSHLGDWFCTVCGDKRPQVALSYWNSPLPGLYNTYNTLAAVLCGREIGIGDESIASALIGFRPAFGRQEEFEISTSSNGGVNKKIKLFLSKNPAGFTASLRAVLDLKPKAILIALNDRIPDGRDVSWIWDVDFELIPSGTNVIVTGDRVYDMGLRIQYTVGTRDNKQETRDKKNEASKLHVEPDTKKAIDAGLESIEAGETLYVLATYSAMLDIRKILIGRKIL